AHQSRADGARSSGMGPRHARGSRCSARYRRKGARPAARRRRDARLRRGEAVVASQFRRVAGDTNGARSPGDRRARARRRCARRHGCLHRQARAALRGGLMRLAIILLLALPSLAAAQDDDYMFLGGGGYWRPKFEGSGERTVELIPAVRYFSQPWFVRTTQGILEGGAQWNLRPGLDTGVQLAYESGPRDHDPNASIGLNLE